MKHNHSIAAAIIGLCCLLQVCCLASCGAYIDKRPHRTPASYRDCDGKIYRRPVYQYDAPTRAVPDREA